MDARVLDKPTDEDFLEGHSQEKLAHSVCDYIMKLDQWK